MIVFNLIVPLVTSLTSSSKVMFSMSLWVAVCGYITHLSHQMWPSVGNFGMDKRVITERPSMHTVQTHVNTHSHILNACRPAQEKVNKVPVTHTHTHSKVQVSHSERESISYNRVWAYPCREPESKYGPELAKPMGGRKAILWYVWTLEMIKNNTPFK